jgi:SAM-dependent methyltransferase
LAPFDDAATVWEHRWRRPRDRAAWSLAEPAVRTAAVRRLAADGVRRILDLGCGVGRHALLLARAGFEVTACDPAPTGLRIARDAALAEGLDVRVHAARAAALPYGDAAFDHVLAFNVLPYDTPEGLRAAIGEIARVLRPGGSVLATMRSKRHAGFGAGHEIAPDTFVHAGDAAHPHLYVDEAALRRLFAGFAIEAPEERAHGDPTALYWHLWASRPGPARR